MQIFAATPNKQYPAMLSTCRDCPLSLRVTPLMLAKGQRVEIDLVNRTMKAHPIHLHGHAFQVTSMLSMPTTRDDGRSTATISTMWSPA